MARTRAAVNPEAPRIAVPASSTTERPVTHVARRRPMPRKGHKKSRAGCVTCKRRKVKCDEGTPGCGPCVRLGLNCLYPGSTPQRTTIPENHEIPSDLVISIQKPLRQELASFTITDLKFFQHFLFAAYPTLPVGGWQVWQEISQLAHHVGQPLCLL